MSSPEQAPEPTMDEILASIRKIIADDEPEGDQYTQDEKRPESAQPAQPGEGWNSGQQHDPAQGAGESAGQPSVDDEILELTNELSAKARQPAEPRDGASAGATQETPAAEPPLGAAGAVQAEHGSATSAASEDEILSALARAGIEHAGNQSWASEDATNAPSEAADSPGPDPSEALSSGANSGSEFAVPDAASDDVLVTPPGGAGQDRDSEPQAPAGASLDTGVYVPGGDEDLQADSPAEQAVQGFEQAAGTAAPAGEPGALGGDTGQPGMSGNAASPGEAAFDTASALAALDEAAAVAAREAESDAATADVEKAESELKQDAAPPAAVSVDAPSLDKGQTLEESVKEMLRPMLREWLDNNMEHIIKSAVKDELNSSGFGNGGKG